MRLRAVQSGVTVDRVRECTGFELVVADDVGELPPPSAQELAIYRQLRDGASGVPAAESAPTDEAKPATGQTPAPAPPGPPGSG